MRLLDHALDGESAEVKARVLNVLIRYQIDVENEFILLFIAMGQLLAITEDAPTEWQNLFKSFAGELELWSQNFLRTIHEINHQAKSIEQLTITLNNSNSIFKELLTILLQLSETYKRSQQDMNSLSDKLDTLKTSLTSRLEKIECSNVALNVQLQTWFESNQQNNALSWSVSLALMLGLVLGLGGSFLLWRDTKSPSAIAPVVLPMPFSHQSV
ncbi:hypothetical protein DXZ20_36485 [Leptolyngbyaceae cyanobacterium CCMR0081]|uniref:Uncharacterized protein n=2 Tax=Adonisia TaxID=2950183 RepID=A0A6M0RZG1_9CYAN|nr:hypothetical protein [Adonisia turfae CCMR0081]